MSANPSSSTSGGGGSSGSGGGGGGGGSGPCGACKFLRRKCVAGCIFAPYFDSEQGAAHFAAVHKVFGASNVSKLLLHIPVHKRLDAVVTVCYEAQARLRDPVYGCVAHIFALQQQVVSLQTELSYLQAHLATLELPSPPPVPPPPTTLITPPLSIADLPSTSSVPATYDLSSLFEPIVQPWAMQQRPLDPRQFGGATGSSSGSGGGDLQVLARELLDRHGSPPHGSVPCSDGSSPSK
ncbi:Lateral organ boundaries domain containing protein [Parasponia andersonii]|uniref:Lateral organ boundaries domain containing protein n=1 Tax=Parasponia andersonii TaxID=3476 RepID=A0A2P5BHV9_PARAD|nr:Lateral organ boundaries domain containing protein [Parasponia andersonii]